MNNTTEAQSVFQVSLEAKICLYIAFIAIFLLGIIGNSAVIYLIGIRQKATKNYDIQILSLSTTDLLASFFVPIVNIHDLVTNYTSWELFGNIGCKIFLSSNHLTIVVSALMLVLISLTRFKWVLEIRVISIEFCLFFKHKTCFLLLGKARGKKVESICSKVRHKKQATLSELSYLNFSSFSEELFFTLLLHSDFYLTWFTFSVKKLCCSSSESLYKNK